MIEIFELLRSIGFGGMIGGGVAGLLYAFFPQAIAPTMSLANIMLIGGLLGGGLHKFIENYLGKYVFKPIKRRNSFYSELADIERLYRQNLISAFQKKEYTDKAIEKFLQGREQDL